MIRSISIERSKGAMVARLGDDHPALESGEKADMLASRRCQLISRQPVLQTNCPHHLTEFLRKIPLWRSGPKISGGERNNCILKSEWLLTGSTDIAEGQELNPPAKGTRHGLR
jgi:hypothetical protein